MSTRGLLREELAVVQWLTPAEFPWHLAGLVDLLCESVNGGASLGFLAPLSRDRSREYWLSLKAEIDDGSRLLLIAYLDDQLVGTGQIELPVWPNARHRAELQKLFVTTALRGRGVGRALVTALHDAARRRGRSLLLLNTRRGDPSEAFYKRLGYREVGVTPGYTLGHAGQRYDNVTLYQEMSPC